MRSEEVSDKVRRLRDWMREAGYDAVALGGQTHVSWLCAGLENVIERSIEAGLVRALVTSDGAYLITQNIEGPRLEEEEQAADLGLQVRTFPWYRGAWDETMRELAPGRIASDGYAVGDPKPDALRDLRLSLLDDERVRLRALGKDAAVAMEAALRATRSGDTERAVAARFTHNLEAAGIVPAVLLVGGDQRRRAFRHPTVSDTPIEESAMCVLVGIRGGLNIALTRSITLVPPDETLARNHVIASEVEAAMVQASRPGATYGDALQAGIDAYGAAGLPDEWRRHYQGGGIGYHIREVSPAPLEAPTRDTAVAVDVGHAVAWNPTVRGAKAEDTYLITDEGPELVTWTGEWPAARVETDRGAVVVPSMLELTAD